MNKMRIYHILAFLWVTLSSLCAQDVNKLYVSDVNCMKSMSVDMPVYMDNTNPNIVALQFQVTVPEGTSINTAENSVVMDYGRAVDHRARIASLGGNKYRVMVLSPTNKPFKANKGRLFTLQTSVASDATMDQATPYPVTLSDVVLSDSLGNNVMTAYGDGSVSLLPNPDFTVSNIRITSGNTVKPGDDITLAWQVNNIGSADGQGGWSEQITFVSESGETLALTTMHYHETALQGTSVERTAQVQVPRLVGLDGDFHVQIKLIPNSDSGESAEYQGNNTSRSSSSYVMKKLLYLTLPGNGVVTETDKQNSYQAYVERSGSRLTEQIFTLNKTSGDSRVSVPTTVNISKGSNRGYFMLQVAGNDVIDDDSIFVVRVAGGGYNAIDGEFKVIDDEYPDLVLTPSKSDLTEGDVFTLTITSSRPVKERTRVRLSSSAPRFKMPSKVFIEEGQTTVTAEFQVLDDQEVQSPLTDVDITATAYRYNNGIATVFVADNDMPELELTLTPTTVSESAGPSAMVGKIVRKGALNANVTIRLSDNGKANDLYYSTRVITLKPQQTQANFTIGVTDNALKEGDREVTLTAAIWISSCGCSAGKTSGGYQEQVITILDNDGPALTLSSARSNLLEGSTDNTFTVTRNDTPTQDLTVEISSTHDTDVVYPNIVTIPAGQRSATFKVEVKRNDQSNDAKTITFSANSGNYSKGICWIMTTDQTKPDAVVKDFQINSPDFCAGKTATVYVVVENQGYTDLTKVVPITVYFGNEKVAGTVTLPDAVEPGGSQTAVGTITLPSLAGHYKVQAVVNEKGDVSELTQANNRSSLIDVAVLPLFTATAKADKTVYKTGDIVQISGHAEGVSPRNADVEVYVISGSVRNVVKTKTDDLGDYTATWEPVGNQAGRFIVGACTIGENLTTPMDTFDIYGMRKANSGFLTNEFEVMEEHQGYIEIVNHGSLPLKNIQVIADQIPDNVEASFGNIYRLAAGATGRLTFTLKGKDASTGKTWDTFDIHLVSDEGAKLDQTIYYYITAATPLLKSNTTYISTTMTRGQSRTIEVTLTNRGNLPTGDITLDLGGAKWLSAATPTKMASLARGEESVMVLQLTPTPDMEVFSIQQGNIYLSCANGGGLSIGMRVETVSEATGSMVIDVWDEFTANTEEAPHVEGATVTLKHPVTQKILHQTVTGSDGLATFSDIAEGNYYVSVTHPKHNSWSSTVTVDPGRTTRQRAFIQYSAITVNMTYEETEIEDVYNIVTNVTYETNVPKPVVLLDMPDKIILDEIQTPYIFYATLTNVGLMTALGTRFTIPDEVNGYRFTPLLEGPWDILPQQQIVIPIQITEIEPSESEAKEMPMDSRAAKRRISARDICGIRALAQYFVNCNHVAGDMEEEVSRMMHVMDGCVDISGAIEALLRPIANILPAPSGGGGGGGGGGAGFGGSGGGGSMGYVACDPFLAEHGPDIISALLGLANGPSAVILNFLNTGFAISDAFEGNPNDFIEILVNLASDIFKNAAGDKILGAVSNITRLDSSQLADGIEALSKLNDLAGTLNDLGLADLPHIDLEKMISNAISKAVQSDAKPMAGKKVESVSALVYLIPVISTDTYMPTSLVVTDVSWYYDLNRQANQILSKELRRIRNDLDNGYQAVYGLHKRTGKLSEPFYDRGISVEHPEDFGELPDWYPSYLRQMANAISVPMAAEYYAMQFLREIFGDNAYYFLNPRAFKSEVEKITDCIGNRKNMIPANPLFSNWPFYGEISYNSKEYITSTVLNNYYEGLVADRVNNTIAKLNGESVDSDNYIDFDYLTQCVNGILEARMECNRMGYATMQDLIDAESEKCLNQLNRGRNSVCSTVKLQIDQTMTMTRQAVRGTLTVVNGSDQQPMKDVKLNLVVTDPDGNVADSHIMEIHTESMDGFTGELDYESGWTLGAKETGVAKILFIPTKYAAPTEPLLYTFSGTISFIDPFTGLPITRELESERLTVRPSPVLDLTYFMQRDIFGDDPLTETVEPKVPSQFSLLINNKGYGDATKVKMVTQQPKIIENEKGLLVDFEILSSQLNGGEKTLALGESVLTDFGNIPAHSQTYAQWWLTCSLTGHFVDYDVQATHVTSYDNPDLTLLDSVTIHELIHTVKVPHDQRNWHSSQDNWLVGFMANDEVDTYDYADCLYLSDARKLPIHEVKNSAIQKVNDTEYKLTVMPSAVGWNYGNTVDPTGGSRKIKSVFRMSDNATLPVDNFWQTDRTLVDKQEPIYENLIHFADSMALSGETYVVRFEERPAVTLAVSSISGIPVNNQYTREQVGEVTVAFNKPIAEATFTTDDVTLMHEGEYMDVSGLQIIKVNDQAFTFDLSSLTDLDGYYALTIQTAAITDEDGFAGEEGKMVGWIQIKDGKARLTMVCEPTGAGELSPGSGLHDFQSDVLVSATANTGYSFLEWRDGDETVSSEPSFTYPLFGPKTLTAVFQPKNCQLYVDYFVSRGSVEGAGTGIIKYGQHVILKAVPKEGYYLKEWKKRVNDDQYDIIGDDETLEIDIDGNVTYQAVFEPIQYVLVELDENSADNVSLFTGEAGQYYRVTSNRKMISGQWNTFCVPFDISEQQVNKIWGYNTLIAQFTSIDEDVMNFDYVHDIKAGMSYLIKPERTVDMPVLELNDMVSFVEQPIPSVFGDYQYVGVYSPRNWDVSSNLEYYYVASTGTLSNANSSTEILKGMHGYFMIPEGGNAEIRIGGMIVAVPRVVPSNIVNVGPVRIYNLQGQYVGSDPTRLSHGIYIINGKKQYVK